MIEKLFERDNSPKAKEVMIVTMEWEHANSSSWALFEKESDRFLNPQKYLPILKVSK